MTKKKKISYPKVITGQVLIAGDSERNIPEIEVSFILDRDSLGDRKISSVTARYPDRYSEQVGAVTSFPQSKVIVTFSKNAEAYSVMMTSLEPFLSEEGMEMTAETDIETYCNNSMDMDLHVLLNACQVTWSMLMEASSIVDLSAYVVLRTIKSYSDRIKKKIDDTSEPDQFNDDK